MENPCSPTLPARTRREMQAETRARLMQAALQIIAARGVAAASIRGICDAAGFSQGAFYSNFSSKDDLLIALIQDHMAGLVDDLDRTIAQTEGLSLQDNLAVVLPKFTTLAQMPAASVVVVELHLHARRSPSFAKRFAPVRHAYQAQFTRITQHLIARHDLRPSVPAPQIAWAMTAFWSGAVTQAAPDEATGFEALMAQLFESLTGAADQTPKTTRA